MNPRWEESEFVFGDLQTAARFIHQDNPIAGSVLLNGGDITQISGSELRARRRKFQLIFQDPYGSLNPRMTVEQIVGEALDIHQLTDSKSARQKRIAELLNAVGLDPVYAQRYPHEFSGGQRQRIGIARARWRLSRS